MNPDFIQAARWLKNAVSLRISGILLLLGAFGGGAFGAEPVGPASLGAAPEGKALAEELRRQKPGLSQTNNGVLRIRDARNKRRELPVTVKTLVTDRDWQIVYQVRDGTNGVLETLVVRQTGDGLPQYDLARRESGAAVASAPLPVAAGASAVPLAGTDFWLCDLGLEFLHWPNQRVARQEMSNGRLCWALDSVNPGTNGYASVRSWIDAEYHALLRAEAYDAQRRKVKEFSTGSFKQVTTPEGHEVWFLKDIRIRDEFRDTRTDLIYELPGD